MVGMSNLGKPVEILLVEDNPADIRLAREALKEWKLNNALHVVMDGEEALAYLRREGKYADASRPDMLLLDLNLPKMDGSEVWAEMHRDPELQTIPVAVLTASKTDTEIVKRFGLPTKCYIVKPLEIAAYLGAVRCFEQFSITIVSRPCLHERADASAA
jgi:chemotaxis family two-component system response regulator Rcp1